jgi:hypothetical protein
MRLGEYLNVKKMQNGGSIGGFSQGQCPIGFFDVNGQCKTFDQIAQMIANEKEQNQIDEDIRGEREMKIYHQVNIHYQKFQA